MKEGASVRDQYRSLEAVVASTLREWILDHTLAPNERLRQEDLAARLGISRGPVRDALRRLETEGLVTIDPRGAVVADMSPATIWEDYNIRCGLEGQAARVAAERMTAPVLAILERALFAMQHALTVNDPTSALEQFRVFHDALYEASALPRVCAMIKTLRNSGERYRRTSMAVPGQMARSIKVDKQILAACRAGDAERVERLVKTRLLDSASELIKFLKAKSNSETDLAA